MLGLLAALGDVVVLIIGVASLFAVTADLLGLVTGGNTGFGDYGSVFIAVFVGLPLDAVLAVIGLVLGIVAVIRRRGRAFGVLGIVLSGLVLATRILVLVVVVTNGSH